MGSSASRWAAHTRPRTPGIRPDRILHDPAMPAPRWPYGSATPAETYPGHWPVASHLRRQSHDWRANAGVADFRDRDAQALPAEIGRASLRERVWQYVLVTVVAVSLKTKTNKK